MPAVTRIGDHFDCGDTQAQGSGNVFINGIPVARLADVTEGHCFSSVPVDSASGTVFANNKGVARIGDHHPTHCCNIPCHDGSFDVGSPDVFADDGIAGSMAAVPLTDAAAATYGLDKAEFAAYGVILTYGHLAEPYEDDDFSEETESSPSYAVVPLDVYKTVVPDTADVTGNPPPPGLNSVQARKFIPVRPPGGGTGVASPEELTTSKTYGHDPDRQKAPLGEAAPPATTFNATNVPTDYTDIDNWVGTFPANFPLSTNFTVGQLSFGYNGQPRAGRHPLRAQGGLTIKDIVKNLRALAVNVLEPMRLHFPDMLINSGFRTPAASSQHTKGEAADVYVPSLQSNKDAVYQGALWVRDSINYDQFIFETTGNNIWYHVSYNRSGNRSKTASNAHMTTSTGGAPYTNAIVRLA